MVEPPWTHEALELIAGRICALQDRYGAPFLIEHVARAFAEGEDDEMDTASFINALQRRTGCGLLLDVYNLECDHHNFAADPIRLLDALDLAAVCEIHVAGGTMHHGYKMDIHSRTVTDFDLGAARPRARPGALRKCGGVRDTKGGDPRNGAGWPRQRVAAATGRARCARVRRWRCGSGSY